jgi:hypothetical protein
MRPATNVYWSRLPFGAHRGRSLPQVALADPDWLFWAIFQDVFARSTLTLREEAAVVAHRARRVRVRGRVELGCDGRGRLASVTIDRGAAAYDGVDLSIARALAGTMDKRGSQILLDAVRRHVFGGARLTRARCEAFFADPSNFLR